MAWPLRIDSWDVTNPNIYVSYIWNEYIDEIEIQGLSCSDNMTLLLANERVFSMGKERTGRLGKGPHLKYLPQPHIVDFPNKPKIKGIAAGRLHCLAWDSNGVIYSWGDGADGKLGHPTDNGGFDYFQNYPLSALDGHKFVQASCGYYHSCGLTTKGEIYTWGRMQYENWEARSEIWVEKTFDANLLNFVNGRTYHPPKDDKAKSLRLDALRPKKLVPNIMKGQLGTEPTETFFVKVSSRARQNVALNDKGQIFTWGANRHNCLGFENFNSLNNPLLVSGLEKYKVVDASCGNGFTVIILADIYDKGDPFGLQCFKETQFSNIREKINKIKVSRNEMSLNQRRGSIKSKSQNQLILSNKTESSELKKSQLLQQRSQANLTGEKSVMKEVLTEYGLADSKIMQTSKITKPNGKARPKTAFSVGGGDPAVSIELKSFKKASQDEKIKLKSEEKSKDSLIVFDSVAKYVAEKETAPAFGQKAQKIKAGKDDKKKFDDNITIAMNISDLEHFDRDSLFQKKTGASNKIDMNNYYNSDKIQRFLKKRNKSAQAFLNHEKRLKPARNEDYKIEQQNLTLHKSKNASIDVNNNKFSSIRFTQTNVSTFSAPALLSDNLFNFSKSFINEIKLSPKERQQNKIKELTVKRDNRIKSANYKRNIEELIKKKSKYEAFLKKNKDVPSAYRREAERLGIYNSEAIPLNWALNWFTYTNLEKIISFINIVSCEGIKIKKERFRVIKSAKKIQRHFRNYLVEKRFKSLTPESIRRLRNSFLKNCIMRRILKKCKAAKKVIFAHIVRKIKRNLGMKLFIVFKSASQIQSFFLWSLKTSRVYKNYIQEIWDSHLLNICRIKDHTIPSDLVPDHINKDIRDRRRGGIESGSLNRPIVKFSTYIKLMKDQIEKTKEIKAIEIAPKHVDEQGLLEGIMEDALTSKFEFLLEKLKIRKMESFAEKVDVQEGILKKQKDNKVVFQQLTGEDQQVVKKGLVVPQRNSESPPTKQATLSMSRTQSGVSGVNNNDEHLDSLLPYTRHSSELAVPLNLMLKFDSNQTAHEAVFKELTEYEIQIKNTFISKLYTHLLKKHRDSLREYANRLDRFILDNKDKINLQRARLMLRTPVDKLKVINEREDLEYKLSASNRKNNKPDKKPAVFEKDHLPFAHLKKKLALALPNAPKRPNFLLSISQENFKKLFEEYSQNIHSHYSLLISTQKRKMFEKKKRPRPMKRISELI